MTPVIRVLGTGAVSPLGVGIDAIRATRTPPEPDDDGVCTAPFDPRRDLPKGLGRRVGRQSALALAAALEAVEGVTLDPDAALVLGTTHGALAETADFIAGACEHGADKASPLQFAGSLHNAMAGVLGRALGLRGPAIVSSTGAVSFESALLVAVAMLRNGHAPQAVVAASDASHALLTRGLGRAGCRPRNERGARVPLGEGAGALVLDAVDDGGYAGVRVEHVSLGTPLPWTQRSTAHVLMTDGSMRGLVRHFGAMAPAPREPTLVRATKPAEWHGVFGSLAAVATAVDANARLRGVALDDVTLLVSAPYRVGPAFVALSGSGRG